MKICIISFDIWGFTKQIVEYLTKKNIEVTFYDTSSISYVYKNKTERVKNFFTKNFLNKNVKKDYLNRFLTESINSLPEQDYILIINPFQVKPNIFNLLKNKTKNLIAYNYDSLKRMPIPESYLPQIDQLYSFDIKDVKEYKYLNLLTNFIYLPNYKSETYENKAFMILSNSESREKILDKIATSLNSHGFNNNEFLVLNPAFAHNSKQIKIITKQINLNEVIEKMKNAEILIDLVRENQTGLSFRVFEAMALNKKIITNNKSIIEYDFYNENNILIIDNSAEIPSSFLENKYQEIPREIYNKYTLKNFTATLFPKIN